MLYFNHKRSFTNMNKAEEVKNRHLPRWASSSKRRALLVLVVLAIFLGSVTVYLYVHSNSQSKKNLATTYYKEGEGGDPNLVIKYHREAVSVWKAGDEAKAKSLAKKGIEQANKLTIAQQAKIPNEISVVFELNDLADGVYYGK